MIGASTSPTKETAVPGAAAYDPARGVPRLLRAVVCTLVALGPAAVAHATVQGCVSAIGTAEALVACGAGSFAVLGRQRSRGALLLWLVGCQSVTHGLLEWHCAVPAGPVQHAGSLSVWARPLLLGESGPLLLAHVLAVLLTFAVLSRTDAALWAAHRLGRAVRRLVGWVVPAVVVPAVQPLPSGEPRFAGPLLRGSIWQAPHPARRGPPRLAVAL
jgi:hypothetical protein